MEPIYIFGHKKPDTDSVCASISLAYLKNALGIKCEPRVLGTINEETNFVLKYFNVPEPAYLSDVKIQIKDLSYNKKAMLSTEASIDDAASFMIDNNITGIPLIDNNKKILSYVNLKDIAREFARGDISRLETSYDNLLRILNGKEILRFNEEINGNLIVASYNSMTFLEHVKLKSNNILIVGDRLKILEYAINSGIKLIILLGKSPVAPDYLKAAERNKVNIIMTEYTTFETANKMKLANYVKSIATNNNPVTVDRLEYLSDFLKKSSRFGHTNYPVINNKKECAGLVSLKDLREYDKKRVILVDHNQFLQSVEGIEEAEIVEIIDHHNFGLLGTNYPIYFRVMPVGSTCTIIYNLFEEKNVKIPKDIAGIMLASILSDTLALESPTTTELDKKIAFELAKKCKIDIKKFSMEMFRAGSSLKGRSIEDILYTDYKEYKVKEYKIFLSQILSLNFSEIEANINEFIKVLNDLTTNKYKYAILLITDITRNGSYLIFNNAAAELIATIYNLHEAKSGMFVDGLVSRKKQLVPDILELL